MVVGIVVVALSGVVAVRLHCEDGWGGVGHTIGLILISLMHTCIFVYQIGKSVEENGRFITSWC